MKETLLLLVLLYSFISCKEIATDRQGEKRIASAAYIQNRAPLKARPYLELPLGAIRPKGWLNEQLERMATGLTGNLDSSYPEVVGPRNG